eukprot:PhM_4_TR11892/c0_g1_i1/m.42723/K15414/C1QBP; complement component 1 Q subcomponent-binding protein, mitochondrial
MRFCALSPIHQLVRLRTLHPAKTSSFGALFLSASRTHIEERLADDCIEELRNELIDNTDSVPPLPPRGWLSQHRPGSNVVAIVRQHDDADAMTRHIQEHTAEGQSRVVDTSARPESPVHHDVCAFAHFECKDPSLHSPSMDTCEYLTFLVRLQRPGRANELWCRLAYVNSVLHIEGVAAVPRDHPLLVDAPPCTSPVEFSGLAEEIDRTLYQGPRFKELSKEFQEFFMSYLVSLGIDNGFGEYVAQATYYAENEEYQRWLGRIAHFVNPDQKPKKD